MHYDMKAPCDDCPFLKEGGIRLTEARVLQITHAVTDSRGSTFACHKTTIEVDDDLAEGPKSRHCAGALIYAEKQGAVSQMVRIAERLRMYNPKDLMSNKDAVAKVFDSPEEMLEANS